MFWIFGDDFEKMISWLACKIDTEDFNLLMQNGENVQGSFHTDVNQLAQNYYLSQCQQNGSLHSIQTGMYIEDRTKKHILLKLPSGESSPSYTPGNLKERGDC